MQTDIQKVQRETQLSSEAGRRQRRRRQRARQSSVGAANGPWRVTSRPEGARPESRGIRWTVIKQVDQFFYFIFFSRYSAFFFFTFVYFLLGVTRCVQRQEDSLSIFRADLLVRGVFTAVDQGVGSHDRSFCVSAALLPDAQGNGNERKLQLNHCWDIPRLAGGDHGGARGPFSVANEHSRFWTPPASQKNKHNA